MTLPERIGKYQISAVLGRGSMGTVYKGFDPHIHRPVAIKTLHRELLGDPDAKDSFAARFRNEAKAVGRIAHPGVVAIYEYGEDGDVTFIAMEYVEGHTLDAILAVPQMLPEANVLSIMDQLLESLAIAHAQGVWHRDIKPANLILTAAGQVKLTDFGIARLDDAHLTQASSMIGTPAYMAPEQFVGEGIDHRADLFACGALLYRMLTGRRAFTGSSEVVMYKILNEQPEPPSVVTQGARPPAYDAIVARALAKRAADRYPDAQSMRLALQGLAHGVSSLPPKATVILPAPLPASAPGLPAHPVAREPGAAATALHSGATASQIAGWDPAELSRIERALASHVGPMARVMVRQAARTTSDPIALATEVSRHIAEAGKRQRFLELAQAGSHVVPVAPPAAGAAAAAMTGSDTAPLDPLTDDFKAKALPLLTRRMGPIARVMIRRAAEQACGSRPRFVQLLVEGMTEGERSGLLADLGKLEG